MCGAFLPIIRKRPDCPVHTAEKHGADCDGPRPDVPPWPSPGASQVRRGPSRRHPGPQEITTAARFGYGLLTEAYGDEDGPRRMGEFEELLAAEQEVHEFSGLLPA
jgi:hypothetical protein